MVDRNATVVVVADADAVFIVLRFIGTVPDAVFVVVLVPPRFVSTVPAFDADVVFFARVLRPGLCKYPDLRRHPRPNYGSNPIQSNLFVP